MNSSAENIIINSCQYTPVYVIQNPNFSQVKSFVVSPNNESAQNPVNNNLKTFYENSGKIANNLDYVEHKPKILKKVDSSIFGNNLKLANFLIHKNETSNEYVAPINNIVLKPVVASRNTTNVVNTVPKLEMNRKIVKLKNIPNSTTTSNQTRKLPKIKPKENSQNLNKHTSVQLLKLGETYHSLNQLSDDQMKIVNHALKIFNKPENTPKEPAYDPVTNTRYIYKVLSPKDLTVVGKKNLIFTQKKPDIKKEFIKKESEEDVISKKKAEKKEVKPFVTQEVRQGTSLIRPVILETKVTRSGRKVKLPKHHSSEEETPQKPKRKNGTIVSCFQCSSEFSSLYRLQRHYENHPTHIPAKVHSNLFHCLLAIIKSGSEEDRANIFIQQLEQLIAKFKSLLPCLLKKVDSNEGKLCNINDDIGRLFGMDPGKYNLNMDALNCVKDKEGHCRHNPANSNQFNSGLSNPSQIWTTKQNVELSNIENEVDDCARIISVAKWPTVSKRNWKQKPQSSNAKKMKIEPECDTAIELEMDDHITFSENDVADLKTSSVPHIPNNLNKEPVVNKNLNIFNEQVKKPSHVQFHSAHFDIRSSPIKQSSTVFCKFQIDPEKIPKYEVQVIKPLGIESKLDDVQSSETLDTSTIFSDGIELPTKGVGDSNLDFVNKDWAIGVTNEQSESDIQSNTLIEPALLHIKDDNLSKSGTNIESQNDNWETCNDENQNQSVLNFLDSLGSDCLSYPATEIRNNTVDFQLDLY